MRVRPVRVSPVTEGGMTLPSTGPLQTFGFNGRSRGYVNQGRRSGAVNIRDDGTAVVIAAAVSKSGSSNETSSSAEWQFENDWLPDPDRFCGLLGRFQTGKQ